MATLVDYSPVVELEGVIVEPPLIKLPSPNTDRDSGSWSIDDTIDSTTEDSEGPFTLIVELPGADLSQDELIETFMTQSNSKIPIPPPLPPLLSSVRQTSSGDPSIFWHPFRHNMYIFPGAFISDYDFAVEFTQNPPPIIEQQDTRPLCPICCENRACSLFSCCDYKTCKLCVQEIIKVNINEGRIFIPCLNPDCNKPMTRDFINEQLITDRVLKEKYERFRVNHEENSSKKTCPNCCMITEREDLPPYKSKQVTPQEYNITCDGCTFSWCFNCHSPWHEGISCEMYRQGDRQFQKWTKHRNGGFIPNCQKCPKCKVFIERSSGCDHMTCNRCNEHFCYKCGGNFTSYPLLGDHYKKLGVLGCPYNYKPDQPIQRKLIRGGYLFAKASATTGYPILLVGGCVVVIVGAGVIAPIVGSYALYRYIRRKRRGW